MYSQNIKLAQSEPIQTCVRINLASLYGTPLFLFDGVTDDHQKDGPYVASYLMYGFTDMHYVSDTCEFSVAFIR